MFPAVTDIILQMGAQDRLVGVSNYEPGNPELKSYPRIGDYQIIDWEKLTQIRPDILVISRPKQELAPVFQEHANALNAELFEAHIDRLDEIPPVIQRLGNTLREQEKAKSLAAHWQSQLAQIAQQAKTGSTVRALIVLDKDATFAVGPNNYLNDLLTMAGGTNVAASLEKDYPTIDREKLLQLDPDVIIQLLPEAPPQVVSAAGEFWKTLPQLKAVQNDRVYTHTQWYLLLPSARAADVGVLITNDLHPLTKPATSPTTVPSRS